MWLLIIALQLGWTPLMTAAANGYLSVVREFIFLEADVNVQDKKVCVTCIHFNHFFTTQL